VVEGDLDCVFIQKKIRNGILLMIASSCCVCVGQLFWKMSVGGNWLYLCLGFLLYGAGFIAMVSGYKYGSVSKLQPILSLSYVFAVLLGLFVLGESITLYKIAGVIIITAGVIVIGSSAD